MPEPWRRTVAIVADLSNAHVGKLIRVPDLHQPGEDFGAPLVTVRGTLQGIRLAAGGAWLDVRRTHAGPSLLDTPVPLSHPCFLVFEDPKATPPVEVALFDEGA